MRFGFVLLFSILLASGSAQDSLYTRMVLKKLCSKEFFGRGYVKGGLGKAEKFIVSEIGKTKVSPLFDGKYTQSFYHQVNTFPEKIKVCMNGRQLVPGVDFIPAADNGPLKGKFHLTRKDSVSYTTEAGGKIISVLLKDKLTYTVARNQSNNFTIEVDRKKVKSVPEELEINFKNKLVIDFESRNIGCVIAGSSSSDSMIVFTAHYDHLGGIGKSTFFPGANDNASGVSMILNLIRHYDSHPPKYKTVFIFFAGEEAGLLGSKYFTESKTIDLKKIKFLINLDLLGTGEEGIMVVNGAIYTDAFNKLTGINSEKHLLSEIKKRGKAANSDHYWFSEQGVPCFFIYTMGGIKAYHDVYDVEKTLSLTKYKEIFQLLLDFTSSLK